MISILNSSLERVAIIKDLIKPWRFEEINGENKLDFSAVLTEKVSNYVNENNIAELDDDYFDIAYYSKDMNEDGTAVMAVECEHISYRLNNPEYNLDYCAFTGTPTAVLTQILNGTGFTVGTVEFTANITYSSQEKKSRRGILMEFVALLGGEAKFNKFSISILERRGSSDLQIFTKGKNIKVISKIFDGRENPPKIAYTCAPIALPDRTISLGDDILLIQPELGIQETLRAVSIGYNPVDNMEQEIEIANYVDDLEDQLYKIQTTTVSKDKIYNGCKIGPDEGFVAIKSDNTVKSTLNATEGISIKLSDDDGETWDAVFYVTIENGIPKLYLGGNAKFKGDIETTKDATIGEVLKLYTPDKTTFNSGIKWMDSNGSTVLAEALMLKTDLFNSFLLKTYFDELSVVSDTALYLTSLNHAVVLNGLLGVYIGSASAGNKILTEKYLSDDIISIGNGCSIDTDGGTLRLKNANGAYLSITDTQLMYYEADGTPHTIV